MSEIQTTPAVPPWRKPLLVGMAVGMGILAGKQAEDLAWASELLGYWGIVAVAMLVAGTMTGIFAAVGRALWLRSPEPAQKPARPYLLLGTILWSLGAVALGAVLRTLMNPGYYDYAYLALPVGMWALIAVLHGLLAGMAALAFAGYAPGIAPEAAVPPSSSSAVPPSFSQRLFALLLWGIVGIAVLGAWTLTMYQLSQAAYRAVVPRPADLATPQSDYALGEWSYEYATVTGGITAGAAALCALGLLFLSYRWRHKMFGVGDAGSTVSAPSPQATVQTQPRTRPVCSLCSVLAPFFAWGASIVVGINMLSGRGVLSQAGERAVAIVFHGILAWGFIGALLARWRNERWPVLMILGLLLNGGILLFMTLWWLSGTLWFGE